jgi:PTS system, glucose subfamily, IIA component
MKIYSPLKGKRVYLENVDDPAFSEKMLGDGVAVEPEGEIVCSPVNGKVSMMFPTKHAIGIISEEGIEVLIHIGLETVNMGGDGFVSFVEEGKEVKIGDKLISFSIDKIIDAKCDTVTMIIITNTGDYSGVKQIANGNLEAGDELLEIV